MNTCIDTPSAQAPLAVASMSGDEHAVQGAWRLVQWDVFDKTLDKTNFQNSRLVIDENCYAISLDGRQPTTGTQRLDPACTPKTIDIVDANGPCAGQMCQGIYEIDGDQFCVVFSPPGQPRPKKFKVAREGQWMHVWKRMTQ